MPTIKKKFPVVRRCIRPMLADDNKSKLASGDKKYILQEKFDVHEVYYIKLEIK